MLTTQAIYHFIYYWSENQYLLYFRNLLFIPYLSLCSYRTVCCLLYSGNPKLYLSLFLLLEWEPVYTTLGERKRFIIAILFSEGAWKVAGSGPFYTPQVPFLLTLILLFTGFYLWYISLKLNKSVIFTLIICCALLQIAVIRLRIDAIRLHIAAVYCALLCLLLWSFKKYDSPSISAVFTRIFFVHN